MSAPPPHSPGPADARPVPPPIVVLIAVSALNPLALNMLVPSMPGLEQAFATSYATVQLSLSLYLIAVALAQLILGPLSDRHGRRPVMLAGMALFLVGTAACLLAPTIEAFILGRVVQGVGSCAGLVLSRAIVRDVYERDRAASMIGFVTMGMAVAPTLGPALGGALDEQFGWRAPFLLLFAVGVAVLAGTWATLNETRRPGQSEGGLAGHLGAFAVLARSRDFVAFAVSSMLVSGVFFAFLGGIPYVMQKLLGAGARETGLYLMWLAAGYILGNFLSGRYATRFGVIRMMAVGNLIGLGAVTGALLLHLAGYHHPVAIFAPMTWLGIGNGIALPSTIAGAVSIRPDLAGAASGLTGTLQIGFGALVTVLMGALLGDSALPLFLTMATLAAGGLVAGLAARAAVR